jgi:Fe-S cluster assembly protein SufD
MIDVMEEKDLYLANFARFEQEAGARVPSWLRALRTEAMDRFAERGFPGPRDEEWRVTPLGPLLKVPFQTARDEHAVVPAAWLEQNGLDVGETTRLAFVNGRFAPELSLVRAQPKNVIVTSLARALKEHPELVQPHLAQYANCEDYPFTALNTAFLRDGAFVWIPKNAVLAEPIHLLFVATGPGGPTVAYPRSLIVAGVNSQATIVQSYLGTGQGTTFTNAVTEVVLDDGALLNHCKVQRERSRASHLETLQVQHARASKFTSHNLTLGGGWVRNEINAVLGAEGCECTLNGLYLGSGNQFIDNHTVIDHAKPHCASHELYKGILDGKARGVFNGKIFVRQDAQKTDAKQTNKTLLLSDDATINTKPQLEIYADDVKCTHGATVGQLSAEAIFYLRTRGIGLDEARRLLTFAFANSIVEGINVEPLRRQLEDILLADQRLPADAGDQEAP